MLGHEILVGAPAVGKLTTEYPDAHKWFGEHESAIAFAITISRPGWLAYALDGCWIITEDKGFGIREIHFFCPTGMRIKTVRRLLGFIFETTGAIRVCGAPVPGHVNEMRTRTLCRAIGAELEDGIYILSKARHIAYNRRDVNPEG